MIYDGNLSTMSDYDLDKSIESHIDGEFTTLYEELTKERSRRIYNKTHIKHKPINDLKIVGAKDDGKKPDLDLVLGDFAAALQLVGDVGTFGAKKYTDHGWLRVDNGIRRYTSAMLRHYFKESDGEYLDPEMNLPHAAAIAWNALARLQLIINERKGKTM